MFKTLNSTHDFPVLKSTAVASIAVDYIVVEGRIRKRLFSPIS
jgi:hypothetical protein